MVMGMAQEGYLWRKGAEPGDLVSLTLDPDIRGIHTCHFLHPTKTGTGDRCKQNGFRPRRRMTGCPAALGLLTGTGSTCPDAAF